MAAASCRHDLALRPRFPSSRVLSYTVWLDALCNVWLYSLRCMVLIDDMLGPTQDIATQQVDNGIVLVLRQHNPHGYLVLGFRHCDGAKPSFGDRQSITLNGHRHIRKLWVRVRNVARRMPTWASWLERAAGSGRHSRTMATGRSTSQTCLVHFIPSPDILPNIDCQLTCFVGIGQPDIEFSGSITQRHWWPAHGRYFYLICRRYV